MALTIESLVPRVLSVTQQRPDWDGSMYNYTSDANKKYVLIKQSGVLDICHMLMKAQFIKIVFHWE